MEKGCSLLKIGDDLAVMNVRQPTEDHAIDVWIDRLNAAVAKYKLTPAAGVRTAKIPRKVKLEVKLVFRVIGGRNDEEIVVARFYSSLTHVIVNVVIVEEAVVSVVLPAVQLGMHKLFADQEGLG